MYLLTQEDFGAFIHCGSFKPHLIHSQLPCVSIICAILFYFMLFSALAENLPASAMQGNIFPFMTYKCHKLKG